MTKTETAALEAFKVELTQSLRDALAPMAAEIIAVRAELAACQARLDKASAVVREMRARQEPLPLPTPKRVERNRFDEALEDLRADAAENGSDRRFWPRDEILRRAARLEELRINTVAAGE